MECLSPAPGKGHHYKRCLIKQLSPFKYILSLRYHLDIISPGEWKDYPLQYSGLENSIDREAWWATVHGVTKSRTRLKQLSMYAWNTYFPESRSVDMIGYCREPARDIPLVTKVMRKGARHTQRRDRASGVPPDILEHLPPKKPVCLLYCFVLSPLTLLGAVPHHHLTLSVKELTYSSN